MQCEGKPNTTMAQHLFIKYSKKKYFTCPETIKQRTEYFYVLGTMKFVWKAVG